MSADLLTVARIVAFIFARGGSKGLPGKNIKVLGNKPLLAHAIATAKACPQIEAVIVSTDDDEIATVARAYGAETPFMRPAELATDDAPEWLAWQHAISWFQTHRGNFEVFVSLPTTSPLRAPGDVEACIDCLLKHDGTDMVITGSPAVRSPYFNMVKRNAAGVVTLAIEGSQYSRRQDAPQLFDITTVAYVARPEFVLRSQGMFDGNVRLVEVPPERALDIDSAYDFELAEFLISRTDSAISMKKRL